MALSPRTKMRLYRQRMPEAKRNEMKEKNRQQQAKCRGNWSTQRKIDEQRKNTLIQKKLRQQKKSSSVSISPVQSLGAFSSRQASGKALKKLKQTLPSTPRRRKSVIQQLAKEHGVSDQATC